MQRIQVILLVLLLPFITKAQTVRFNLSRQMIIPGESFSIQYILEDLKKDDEIIYPVFKKFRVVSGPYEDEGSMNDRNGPKPLKTITYTLIANYPGQFIIEGPAIRTNGKMIRTGNFMINVFTKKEALEKKSKETYSDYFLRPGEDPYEKIRKNLFMKVMVNKKECYVGEPILATFKLYSRLTSKSDIVKNPGFYGFTVHDIINLGNNMVTTETVNGKPFDVHTVRSVQLYPLQAGLFTVDPMEVMNKVEFSKSAVNKKTEQEIVEGVFENNDPPHDDNTVVYENSISTEKIMIHVKSLPEAKKPATFNGATGNFYIRAGSEKNQLAKNEKGVFVITVSGKGNFTQLSPPIVEWPAGLENFEPAIEDSLDKTQIPLNGYRAFRFSFISSKAGDYTIPAVLFSFFDPDSNRYKTISTNAIEIKVSNEEKKELPEKQQTAMIPDKRDNKTFWIYGGIFLVVVLIILFQLRSKKEDPVKQPPVENEVAVSADQIVQPAQFALIAGDAGFYNLLQKSIWDHLSSRLNLSGSKMNKADLNKALKEKNIAEDLSKEILGILRECEAAMFTNAELAHDKQQLLNRAKDVLQRIKV